VYVFPLGVGSTCFGLRAAFVAMAGGGGGGRHRGVFPYSPQFLHTYLVDSDHRQKRTAMAWPRADGAPGHGFLDREAGIDGGAHFDRR
jgi:hypothetical protein